MLKTCYGLCSLRTGVKIIVIYELICTIMFFISGFVYQIFNNVYPIYDDFDAYYFLQSCIIIITLLKLIASVSLMQATYQNAPHKIFVWIVIACVVYLAGFVVSGKMYIREVYVDRTDDKYAESDTMQHHIILLVFIFINFLTLIEIHVVASYYKVEKHLEEVKMNTKIQNILLKNHTVDIYNIDPSPPVRTGPKKQNKLFYFFKDMPAV